MQGENEESETHGRQTLADLANSKEQLTLVDAWNVSNPPKKQPGLVERR